MMKSTPIARGCCDSHLSLGHGVWWGLAANHSPAVATLAHNQQGATLLWLVAKRQKQGATKWCCC